MMKKLSKQLTIILLLAISSAAHSQFMCTDIVPDTVVAIPTNTIDQKQFDIDLNNDNTADFRLTSAQSGTIGFILAQTGQIGVNNFMLVDGSNGLLALNVGAPIGSSSTIWHQMNTSNPQVSTIFGTFATGTWAGMNDKYIGLALSVASNTYYGWARMSVSGTSNSYTVKEYGYNSVAGASIAAGQACAPPSTFAVTFSMQPTICQSKSLSVTANIGTLTASGYTWSAVAAGPVFSAPNASTTSITFPSPGTYTISVAATSGTMIGNTSHTITVNPTPFISILSFTPVICAGSSAVLNLSTTATSYTWNTTATTSTISISPTVTTTYSVIGSLNGCTNTATFTQSVVVCSGLNQLNEMEYGFTLFPNPATDVLSIRSNYGLQNNIEVTVLDIIGRIHLSNELFFENQNSQQQVNINNLPKGVYFVKLKAKNGNSKVIRILKE